MEKGIVNPAEEDRERLFNEKMGRLAPAGVERLSRDTFDEAARKKHRGEFTEEEDARLLVVGTRYYQDTREALDTFLKQVRGKRLLMRPEPSCKEDTDAIAVFQESGAGLRKVGYIAKEMKLVAKEIIDRSGGRQAVIYVEGAEKNHTSLTAWPVLNGSVARTITRHVFRMPFPSGDIGAIWPLKVTDTALEMAKYFTGNCTAWEKLFLTNLFCRAASADRAFAPAAKYLTDDMRLSGDQNNISLLQNMAVPVSVSEQPVHEAEGSSSDDSRADSDDDRERRCVKAAIEEAVNDRHFRGGRDWGLVKFALEEIGKDFSSYKTFLQYLRSLGFDCLPDASTVSRGYSPIHGTVSGGCYFSDHSDTVETIRKSNIMKMILGFYHKNFA